MLHLSGRECLRECVGSHVVCRTVDEPNRAIFDNVSNKMKADVNMFCMGMVLVIFCEFDRRFVVQEKSCGVEDDVKKLEEEGMKPEGFFCGMGDGNILSLSS